MIQKKLIGDKYKNKTKQRIINYLAHKKALAAKKNSNIPSTVLGLWIHESPFLAPAQTHAPQYFLSLQYQKHLAVQSCGESQDSWTNKMFRTTAFGGFRERGTR